MKLEAIIEQGSDGGYAVCVRSIPGLLGYGLSVEDAKTDFEEVLEEQTEDFHERFGKAPEWENAEIEYRYDLASFFAAFPFINASAFARSIGINQSLMRKYKQGLATASRKQLALIQGKLKEMSSDLNSVRL